MKRLVLAASLAFALVGVSCDDDTTTPRADAGADASKSDVPVATDTGTTTGMCTGTFSRLTRTTLEALSTPGGKCTTAADLTFICTGDIATTARQCGVTCKTLGAPDLADCVSKCLQPKTQLSSSCTSCYRDLVLCTAANCQECVADPNSAACMTCQVTKGCFAGFFGCSGLPSGAPAPADAAPDAVVDAGPVDTGNSADAKVDASGDAKVDAGPDAAGDASAADGADATSDATPDGSTD